MVARPLEMGNAKFVFCDITGTVTKKLHRETQSAALTVKQNIKCLLRVRNRMKGQRQCRALEQ